MFIREIKKRIKKEDGKFYDYVQHRLVESVRTPSGPRQRIVLNLGKLEVDSRDLKALADLIETLASGGPQQCILPTDPKLEAIAQHFSQVLIRKRVQNQEQSKSEAAQQASVEATPEWKEIDVNNVIATNGRKVGSEQISLSYLKELGFFNILDDAGFTADQKNHAAAQVVSRLIHPSSERESARWLNETSGLDELLDTDFSKISDQTLHRSADQLLAIKDTLESRLDQTSVDLFSLNDNLVLYDLTNTYFESPKTNSELAKYGHSKERRTDCPLMTLALIVDGQGFPKRSQILQGNVSEPQTLSELLARLENSPTDDKQKTLTGDKRKTVIIDAGIATQENLENLRRDKRFDYVAVNRQKLDTQLLFDGVPSKTLTIGHNKTLEVKITRHGDETFLLCKSQDREAKETAMFAAKQTKFEAELAYLNQGLKKPRRKKDFASVNERIGRIKERYKIGHLYKIDVKQTDGVATEVSWKFHPEKNKAPGEYILRTSRTDLNDEQISSLHRTLTMIESSFRWLKSDLGLRPNYHQTDHRMSAHIFISVLAYFVLAPILNRLQWGGGSISRYDQKEPAVNYTLPYGWKSVVEAMETLTRVTTTYHCKDHKTMDIRTTLEPTAKQLDILRRLGVNPRPLKNKIVMNL
jgi:transposase